MRLGVLIAESFCTLRLSPGEACIANAGAVERKSASTFDRGLRYAWRTWNQRRSSPAIEFRDVSYRVAGTQVLSGFNLQVQSGETLVLLGRSGSGKTTSLKLVNRLLSPTSGDVRVKGVSNGEADVIRLRRSIGYVIQDVGLFPHFTVERNIGLVPKIEGWSDDRIRARVQELLQTVGLAADMALALSASAIGRAAAARRGSSGVGRRSRNTAHG